MHKLLVINPGSTTTKVSIHHDDTEVHNTTLNHSQNELAKFPDIINQYDYRQDKIKDFLHEKNLNLNELSAIVARGGLIHPIPSGVYYINKQMISDLRNGIMGNHASNLGGIIAASLSEHAKIPGFVVDPVVVDELSDLARISGSPEIIRKSIFHALNQKAVGRKVAKLLDKNYEQANFVITHLGGGISIGVHQKGRVIDVNNALDGEGPLSPERSGSLPITQLIDFCFQSRLSKDQIYKTFVGQGGLVSYLGTNDGREITNQIKSGNKEAIFYFQAMTYQIVKEIGRAAFALSGKIDAIILTGGLAHAKLLTDTIREYVNFLANVIIIPGENEMQALATGVLRVLNGEEYARNYPTGGMMNGKRQGFN